MVFRLNRLIIIFIFFFVFKLILPRFLFASSINVFVLLLRFLVHHTTFAENGARYEMGVAFPELICFARA